MPSPPANTSSVIETPVAPWENSVPAVAAHMQECNMRERKWAELYVMYNNKSRAYREAYEDPDQFQSVAWSEGCRVSYRPWVRAYVRQLERARAHSVELDMQMIIDHDIAIVEGAKFAADITKHIWRACRHCHGVKHRYQWIDEDEYALAVAGVMDAQTIEAVQVKMPEDIGGYGYTHLLEPVSSCPQCGGLGERVTIIADTTRLEGPAAALFKGVKETKSGIEVLFHDVDKAKERLLRVAGAFGDGAADIAKGAAMGAAAGASAAAAAIRAAEKAESLTAEQAARLYLEVMD